MRILVLCLPGIGDALMATPMIRVLKAQKPNATIDAACMSGGILAVMQRDPDVTKALRVPLYGNGPDLARALRVAASLRRERYDVSILAYPGYRREYHAFHRIVGARFRIAHTFPTGYWSELNFLESATVPVDFAAHNVVNNLNLLRPLGIDWRAHVSEDDLAYTLSFSEEERAEGAATVTRLGLDPSRTVAFHPGSTAHTAALKRRWPYDRWVTLCRHLVDVEDRHVLFFAGPDEGDLGEVLTKQAERPGRVMVAPPGDFSQVMKTLSCCELLVSNDNAFGHLAVALGVRVVSLFGVTDYRWSGPRSKTLCTIVHPEPYEPWHRYELKRGVPAGAREGMREISVEQVIAATDGFLSPRRPAARPR